jgi:chromosome segregation ATPase
VNGVPWRELLRDADNARPNGTVETLEDGLRAKIASLEAELLKRSMAASESAGQLQTRLDKEAALNAELAGEVSRLQDLVTEQNGLIKVAEEARARAVADGEAQRAALLEAMDTESLAAQGEVANLRNEIDNLLAINTQQAAAADTLRHDVESGERRVGDLQALIAQLRGDLKNAELTVASEMDKVALWQAKHAEMEREVERVRGKVASERKVVERMGEDAVTMARKLDHQREVSQIELERAREAAQGYLVQVTHLKTELARAEAVVESLQDRLAASEQRAREERTEAHRRQAAVQAELDKAAKELPPLRAELVDKAMRVASLEETVAQLQGDLAELKPETVRVSTDLLRTSDEVRALRSRAERAEAHLAAAEAQVRSLEAAKAGLERDLAASLGKYETVTAESLRSLEQHTLKVLHAERERDALAETCESLASEADLLRGQLSAARVEAMEELSAVSDETSMLRRERQHLHADLTECREELARERERARGLAASLDDANERYTALQTAVEERAEGHTREISEDRHRISQLEAELAAARVELKRVKISQNYLALEGEAPPRTPGRPASLLQGSSLLGGAATPGGALPGTPGYANTTAASGSGSGAPSSVASAAALAQLRRAQTDMANLELVNRQLSDEVQSLKHENGELKAAVNRANAEMEAATRAGHAARNEHREHLRVLAEELRHERDRRREDTLGLQLRSSMLEDRLELSESVRAKATSITEEYTLQRLHHLETYREASLAEIEALKRDLRAAQGDVVAVAVRASEDLEAVAKERDQLREAKDLLEGRLAQLEEMVRRIMPDESPIIAQVREASRRRHQLEIEGARQAHLSDFVRDRI